MSMELVKADAYAQASLEERRAYVSAIAQAGDLLPRSLWAQTRTPEGQLIQAPSPAKVLLLAETGSMLGLHPMAALQSIHIIDGKPTLSANLLAALVRRAGHRLRVTTSGSWDAGTFVARAELTRSDDPDFTFKVEWSKDRAKRAGLLGKKGPWQSYPEAMSKSRAITEVIREGAPDVTIVAAYTPEELGVSNVSEDGSVIELREVPEAPQTSVPVSADQPTSDGPAAEDLKPAAPEDPAAVAAWEKWKAAIDAAEDRAQLQALYAQARPLLANPIPGDPNGLRVGDYFMHVAATLPERVDEATGEVDPEEQPEAEQVTSWPVAKIPADEVDEEEDADG